ncbi:MAG: hypothetical protein HN929_03670, partial [Chloroflexi bacterium]|nr:hypothetical protein [Chloroflexota bacterium]
MPNEKILTPSGIPPASGNSPGFIHNDARVAPPSHINQPSHWQPWAQAPEPEYNNQAEYMIGSVAVSVIFPESDGGIDTETEDWDQNRIDTCLAEITDGLTWWENQEPNANLSFTIESYGAKATSYEPITRDSADQNLWIPEIMAGLGYNSGTEFDRVRSFNDAIRNQKNTDWVYTIFIVDSLNDADGYFADNAIAYAYYGGPFTVLSYDNAGWGIDRMDLVAAHETGHIFWATDEYTLPGQYAGYLNVLEIDDAACMMNHNTLELCIATKGQIGWRDSDADSILDPIDTFPNSTLIPYSPDPASSNTLIYNGTAEDVPLANNNPLNWNAGNDVTINTITNVQYRIDGGNWQSTTSTDGAFDEVSESYTFTTSALTNGNHTIETRAQNSVGNWESSYASDSVFVDNSAPTLSIQNVPDLINSLVNIGGTAADDSGIHRVELTIKNTIDSTYWNGSTWKSTFWDATTIDLSDDVGKYTSLAFDLEGKPAISYQDTTNMDLKYAHWNGISWDIQTVDSTGNTGYFTSLAFDVRGNPAISYINDLGDYLKFARWSGTNWNIEIIDATTYVYGYTSLAFDDNDDPAISYYDWINKNLKFAALNGISWVTETVDSPGDVGNYNSLAFDANGNPAISYYDAINGNLKYAIWNGSIWATSTIDSAGDIGYYNSLAFDTSGNAAISYYDLTNTALKYAAWNGSSWDIQSVDTDGNVGWYSSLAFNSNGNPTISYKDIDNGHLKYAIWNGSTWDITSIDSSGNVGSYCSLAFDNDGNPALSYYDWNNGDLKYASVGWLQATGTTTWTYTMPSLTDGISYSITARAIDNSGSASLYYLESFTFDTSNPTMTIVASDVTLSDSNVGVDTFTVTATYSEAMDNSQIPSITFDPALATTLTNPSGAWSAGNTIYTWTYDIEDAGVTIVDVDVSVDGGKDIAGNTQIAKTNTNYIDLNTTNPTAVIEASDVAIYDGDVRVDAFTVTVTYSETMDSVQIPTLIFDPALTTSLTNPSGAWSVGDTIYTWTYDIENAGITITDVDVTVDGGKDIAGNAQVAKTNTDYIDIDTTNPTAVIEASD